MSLVSDITTCMNEKDFRDKEGFRNANSVKLSAALKYHVECNCRMCYTQSSVFKHTTG